jgi:hypothetical protein
MLGSFACARIPLRLFRCVDDERRRFSDAQCDQLRQASLGRRLVKVEAVPSGRDQRGIILR